MKNKKYLYTGLCLLAGFAMWTAAVRCIDVQTIGPQGTAVGFGTVNGYFHRFTGVRLWLYTLTDFLSIIPLGIRWCFGSVGLCQLIKRKGLLKVDRDIIYLGVFYVTVIFIYLFFEKCVINYRPVLTEGILEASYPSSTTVLVLCVMLTAAVQAEMRIKNNIVRSFIKKAIMVFSVFMVAARLVCGVHWLTDIIGGILLSGGLVAIYIYAIKSEQ